MERAFLSDLATAPGRHRKWLPAGHPHSDEPRSEYAVFLAVDEELREGAALRVAPELSDPVGAAEVGEPSGNEAARRGERDQGHRAVHVGAARPGSRSTGSEVTLLPTSSTGRPSYRADQLGSITRWGPEPTPGTGS